MTSTTPHTLLSALIRERLGKNNDPVAGSRILAARIANTAATK